MKGNTKLAWHKFEAVMIPNFMHPTVPEKTVDILEVFVDDFLGATNISDSANFLHLSCCMLHGIYAIYLPSEVTRHRGGDSVSEKKLNKGDLTWVHEK